MKNLPRVPQKAPSPGKLPPPIGRNHPDALAVDRFSVAMKAKLAVKRAEGRGGWENKEACSAEFLSQLLREHVEKGDPVDVANFCMMLHQRGERIMPPAPNVELTISALQRAHVERQEEWCPDQKPDLSFRGNELGGECGEAQNVIKKLERERHGWRGSRDTVEHLGEELADVIHCAVLVAITAGIDLEPAVIAKFNSTSEKNGLSTMLTAALASSEGRG